MGPVNTVLCDRWGRVYGLMLSLELGMLIFIYLGARSTTALNECHHMVPSVFCAVAILMNSYAHHYLSCGAILFYRPSPSLKIPSARKDRLCMVVWPI